MLSPWRTGLIPNEICGLQSGIGGGFSPSPSVFPRQYHSISAPHTSTDSVFLDTTFLRVSPLCTSFFPMLATCHLHQTLHGGIILITFGEV